MSSDCKGCQLVAQKDRTARAMLDRATHLERDLRVAEDERRRLVFENADLRSLVRELEAKVRYFG